MWEEYIKPMLTNTGKFMSSDEGKGLFSLAELGIAGLSTYDNMKNNAEIRDYNAFNKNIAQKKLDTSEANNAVINGAYDKKKKSLSTYSIG